MIGYLKGNIVKKEQDSVILDVNGVGYQLHITMNTLLGLPHEGEETEFYVHTHVREDNITLYGFTEDIEKTVFTTLIGVSGIGPKLGLTMLSNLKTPDILKAIATKNAALLSWQSQAGQPRLLPTQSLPELME